jgi:glycosyltransferase involved in cell wall biosynthesis
VRAIFVAPNLHVGGVERQWSILLPALIDRGISAEVMTLDGEGRFFTELSSRGLRADVVGLSGRLPARGTIRAVRAVTSRRPDVVVSEGVSAHVVGQAAGLRTGTPHVVAFHSMPEHPITSRQRLILRVVAPRVTACTAVTSAQLEFLASLGFKRNRLRVIPNGVATAQMHKPRLEVRASLGFSEEEFLALFVATLRPEKRPERFIEATVRANKRNPRIRGVMVGGGPRSAVVRRLCDESGSAVISLGPRTDVAELIQAAEVVCLTSDAEALPLSILEAMALGRPVVTTDVGGVRDAVVEGETGFVIPPDDVSGFAAALLKLAGAPVLVSQLGKAGRRRHEARFTVDRMVSAHVDLFERLTAARAEPRERPFR